MLRWWNWQTRTLEGRVLTAYGFESHPEHQFAHDNRYQRGVAQSGRALALGARRRRFESGRPDHYPNEQYVLLPKKKYVLTLKLSPKNICLSQTYEISDWILC